MTLGFRALVYPRQAIIPATVKEKNVHCMTEPVVSYNEEWNQCMDAHTKPN